MKTAVITGITGQDGAYLSKFLLERGYKVFGTYRRAATSHFWRIEELGISAHENLELIEYDLTDLSSAITLLEKSQPQELYNLAAQSFVGVSFSQPVSTADINAIGPLKLLEAIRIVDPKIRFYQASTSEMFGKVAEIPQSESTPFYPRSPYGTAKLFAHWSTINYRESYDIFASSGILFNHESPLRGLEFVTRKISNSISRISTGRQEILELGNLDAKRDWGYAGDYVEGMWQILQHDRPDNFVMATGRTETVREFTELCANAADIDIVWRNNGIDEEGIDDRSGKVIVKINPKFYRPAEVDLLIGDASKIRDATNWNPRVELEELSRLMVQADIRRQSSRFSDPGS